jgi:tagatose-1,6-bisphosphate aldolase non-catalytic subunit AgaZ/GatZ
MIASLRLRHQAEEPAGERPERWKQFRLEMEFTDKLKRNYSLSKRIARASLPKELAAKAN